MNSRSRTLAEVLAPLTQQEFTTEYFGKKFYRSTGQPGRFAGLLPWAEVNSLLRHQRLDVPRLRLVREGKSIPAESFIQYAAARRRPYDRVPRLKPAEITRQLREGATLIVDAVDEIHEPVTELAEGLEAALHSRIQVNLYAGWRSSRGFDLHWDDHDVLILQLSGRKHWKVYGMTREHPLPSDVGQKATPPDTPLWEGLLEDGDLLYIPRGWWHVAVPLDEPTLHLTVGLHNRTGLDLLSWMEGRLKQHAVVRQDLPRFGTPDEQKQYMDGLRDAWMQEWNSGLLGEYLAYVDARSEPRANFALPWSATPEVLPSADPWIRWVAPRYVDLRKNGLICEFACNGKEWRFAAEARPILQVLQDRGQCRISELMFDSLHAATVRIFIKELAIAGLVNVSAEQPSR